MPRHARSLLALGAALTLTAGAVADQQILDDLIVTQSACIGQDCVNGENFGFDTLRLKENNLRIKAQDTSNSASFPTNDWQITFNDSSNGGANKFSIDDIDGGRTPLTLEAGAPSHSLYVDDGGRLGLGTNTPVADVHVKSGNTPTLRLEQDGSSGFTSQTWDLAGNETNFFVRDATNGSKLPFRIFPAAPSDSLVIRADGKVGIGVNNPAHQLQINGSMSATDGTFTGDVDITGDVGIGTTSPSEPLHVARTTGAYARLLRLSNDSGAGLVLHNTNTDPVLVSVNNGGTTFTVNFDDGDGVTEMYLTADGQLTLSGGLRTGTAGSCTNAVPCDGTFQPEFKVPSIEEHAAFMWSNSYLKGVGSTKPGKLFDVTRKTTGILHELELAHIYIEQLHSRLSEMDELKARLDALEAE